MIICERARQPQPSVAEQRWYEPLDDSRIRNEPTHARTHSSRVAQTTTSFYFHFNYFLFLFLKEEKKKKLIIRLFEKGELKRIGGGGE